MDEQINFNYYRDKISSWKKKHAMFYHDIKHVENLLEEHIKTYSRIMIDYRRTKNPRLLSQAQQEIDKMNDLINLIEKYELMEMLSR